MTDFSDDELVSAVLDGEASDTEVARVHADPVLAARLIELRSARDSIARPVDPPSSAQRDAAIAAAIGAAPAAAVTAIDLDDRRRRRALPSGVGQRPRAHRDRDHRRDRRTVQSTRPDREEQRCRSSLVICGGAGRR